MRPDPSYGIRGNGEGQVEFRPDWSPLKPIRIIAFDRLAYNCDNTGYHFDHKNSEEGDLTLIIVV